MKTEKLVREFKYGSLQLGDPDPTKTPEEVKAFYAGTYPELNNAEIEGPEPKNGKTIYEFRKAVGTKGNSDAQASTGAGLIFAERIRQQEEEGYDEGHDDEHDDDSLALAAIAYAAPCPLFRRDDHPLAQSFSFVDVWPDSWAKQYDKRRHDILTGYPSDTPFPLPAECYGTQERVRNLTKAGALIAAEIDRLLRAEAKRVKA